MRYAHWAYIVALWYRVISKPRGTRICPGLFCTSASGCQFPAPHPNWTGYFKALTIHSTNVVKARLDHAQRGLVLFKNAAIPCDASSVSHVSANRMIVSSITSRSMRGPNERAKDFDAATAPGATDKYGSISACTRSAKSAMSTTSLTKDKSTASLAVNTRDDINTWRTFRSPIFANT